MTSSPQSSSPVTVRAPVWSSQEMVDLLEAMARSADRNTLSFTETANIARSAADVIRWLDHELRSHAQCSKVQTYTEVCKNQTCPRGGVPVEIVGSAIEAMRDRNLSLGVSDTSTERK